MIGATIGVLYALTAMAIWCYGSWYIQAHKKELAPGSYDDLFAPWLTTVFVGLLWPLGVPMFLAGLAGNRARQRDSEPATNRREEIRAKIELAKRRRGTDVGPK